jgi:hypothetical protein
MDEQRDCLVCGTPYTPHQGRITQRFCSIQCAGRFKTIEWPMLTCELCGKIVPRRAFKFKTGRVSGYDYAQKFCSRECGYKGRKWRPINPNGHLTQGTGYIRVNLRGGGHILKHRQVMEGMLGRALLPGESAHHRNGQRTDNREANLELWSTRQPPGQRVIDKVSFALEMLRLYPEFIISAGGTALEHSPFNTPP